jgi:hypothetical protein
VLAGALGKSQAQGDVSDDSTTSRLSNKVTHPAVDRSNDVTMPEIGRSNKVTAVSGQPASNKVTRKLRRSDSKDRQIIDGIRNSVTSTGPNGHPALVGDFQPSILTTCWEHTADRVKLTFANEALELHQDENDGEFAARPVSWSLNLGPDRLTEALTHPKGFVGSLAGLINRALERRLGFVPFYWFIVDTEKGRLHLHGGILASSAQLPLIEEAMRHAGGRWSATPRSAEKHQFHCNPERCDYGWITYAIERKAQVKRIIGPNTFFIGKSLRKEAGSLYSSYRRILRGEADHD